jgi:phage tail-like protein
MSEVTGLPATTSHSTNQTPAALDTSESSRIILKHGIIRSRDFWNWNDSAGSTGLKQRDVAIVQTNKPGEVVWRWNFTGAYPVEWTGPDFNAETSSIAFESVTLIHHGISKG